MRFRRFVVAALVAAGSTVAMGSGVADAGLTGCGGYTSGTTSNTSCNTANVATRTQKISSERRSRVRDLVEARLSTVRGEG